jgi:hypothetical protein
LARFINVLLRVGGCSSPVDKNADCAQVWYVDSDGDGFGDLLVGAPYDGLLLYGSAYLLLGSAAGVPSGNLADHTTFTNEFEFTGLSVAGAGDVNNDGFDGMLIGAAYADANGTAYLILGSANPADLSLANADTVLQARPGVLGHCLRSPAIGYDRRRRGANVPCSVKRGPILPFGQPNARTSGKAGVCGR